MLDFRWLHATPSVSALLQLRGGGDDAPAAQFLPMAVRDVACFILESDAIVLGLLLKRGGILEPELPIIPPKLASMVTRLRGGFGLSQENANHMLAHGIAERLTDLAQQVAESSDSRKPPITTPTVTATSRFLKGVTPLRKLRGGASGGGYTWTRSGCAQRPST